MGYSMAAPAAARKMAEEAAAEFEQMRQDAIAEMQQHQSERIIVPGVPMMKDANGQLWVATKVPGGAAGAGQGRASLKPNKLHAKMKKMDQMYGHLQHKSNGAAAAADN